MSKTLIRIVVLLLVPCLIADPLSASGFLSFESTRVEKTNFSSPEFLEQALICQGLDYLHNLLRPTPHIELIHEGSAQSLRSDIGFRAFYQWQIGKVVVEPSLRATWEHEYKYSALPITAGFAGVPRSSGTFFGSSEGHDSAVVDAGVTVQWTLTLSTYLNYDGQLGRDHYNSNAVTGGVKITF